MSQFAISTSAAAPAATTRHTAESRPGAVARRSVYIARQTSWKAIFAGATLALVTQLLLTLLGAGIGLVSMSASESAAASAEGMGLAAGIWWLVTGLISLFVGGLTVGRLSGVSLATDAILHGLLTWAVVTIVSVLLVATTSSYVIGNVFNWVARTGGMPGMHSVVAGDDTSDTQVAGASRGVGASEATPETRTAASPREDAGRTADAGQRNAVSTQEASETLGKASLATFFALLLGAVAAGLGGDLGRRIFNRYDDLNVVGNQPVDAPEPVASEVTHMRGT